METPILDANDLMTKPAATRLLGIGLAALDRLIADGRLTVRHVPGSYPRVSRAEVERIARESTTPARASA